MLTYGFGGGNIVSTPEDLAHFARALFTGNILTPSSMNAMQMFSPNSYSTWCAGYGLGIHHAFSFASDSMLGHDGDYTNLSDMFHSFDYGFTLVTMTNTETQWFSIFDQMYNTIKNYITTGILENAASASVTLFPNPAINTLTITFDRSDKNAAIIITDMTGNIVYSTVSENAQAIAVNTTGFAAGVYVVQIQTRGFIERKKLVVTK